MKLISRLSLLLVALCVTIISFSQEVTNIKVSPKESSVEIIYDLNATADCFVSLYYSNDNAQTWKGPLQQVTGDVGANQKSGKGKMITWDAASELGSIEGVLQFKIIASYTSINQEPTLQSKLQQRIIDVEKQKREAKLASLRKKRNIWIVPAVITAGIGAYGYNQTGVLYEKYKTATTDAASIRKQTQTMAVVYPVAFAAAGFSVLEFILQSGKYSREKKKKVVFSPRYVPKGLGMNMVVKL
ncbi:MAG: hypothetical protein ACK43J_10110 [Chitinophagaceae bacterium]